MRRLAELSKLVEISEHLKSIGLGEVRDHGRIVYGGRQFPILSFHFGIVDDRAPTLVFVAGVHGLEKIGTQIITSFLLSWIELLAWDKTVQSILETCRVVFYPLVNPVGMARNTRSNGNGVDLMRNAPVEAAPPTIPIISGHRISKLLPWFRGRNGLEAESKVLIDFVRDVCFHGASSLVLDVHSGFGLRDSLWFPFAANSHYFPEAARVLAIQNLLERSYPHHTYTIGPQHHAYRTHGDLWDYLLEDHAKSVDQGVFIPLCLEIGSWTWVKKNPRQLFTKLGLFNPVLPHRIKRAERRHFLLFSFLLKVVASPAEWVELDSAKSKQLETLARNAWYRAK